MARYSSERKAALLKKLLPPINMSVAELARQENISEVTLYNWRKHAKDGGSPVPGDNKLTDEWPAEAKFAVVLETAALSEIELSKFWNLKSMPGIFSNPHDSFIKLSLDSNGPCV